MSGTRELRTETMGEFLIPSPFSTTIIAQLVQFTPIAEDKKTTNVIPEPQKPHFKSFMDKLPEWKRFGLDCYWDSFEKALLDKLDDIEQLDEEYQRGVKIPSECGAGEEFKLLMTVYKIKEITGIQEEVDYDWEANGKTHIFMPEKAIKQLLKLRNSPLQDTTSNTALLAPKLLHALKWRKLCSTHQCEKGIVSAIEYGLKKLEPFKTLEEKNRPLYRFSFKTAIDRLPEWKKLKLQEFWERIERSLLAVLKKPVNNQEIKIALEMPVHDKYKLIMIAHKLKEITGVEQGVRCNISFNGGPSHICLSTEAIAKLVSLMQSPFKKKPDYSGLFGLFNALSDHKKHSHSQSEKEMIDVIMQSFLQQRALNADQRPASFNNTIR